jgi:hypothetical protein
VIDRRPPNQSIDEGAAIKAIYAERDRLNAPAKAAGLKEMPYHVDHIVPWRHKRLRGLHTLANLQILTARQDRIKGNRIMTAEQIRQEVETGVPYEEPADLQPYVDAGQALWPEAVDEATSKVNWPARYMD